MNEMTLRQARILSSETDTNNTIEQNTNVNIKITPQKSYNERACPQPHHARRPSTVPLYPTVEPLRNDVNFTQAVPQTGFQEGPRCGVHNMNGTTSDTQMIHEANSAMQMNPELVYPSPQAINNPSQLARERGIIDMGNEIDDLEKKNRFLEMLVEMYENNPLKVNSYVVCESKLLMEMIKLLTDCEKVDLVLNNDISCGGCSGKSDKIIYISKILITINGKSEDLKYARNDVYSEFVRYGLSMKMTC